MVVDLSFFLPSLLDVQFTMNNANVEVVTEQLLYDGNNLFADTGGLLGLLLGVSVLSLYGHAADW